MPDLHSRTALVAAIRVAISIYHQPLRWILRAIGSVQQQSCPDWELCIRLDGPDALASDALLVLEASIADDPRISLIRGGQRLGCFGSYREIFSSCTADFLAQLDADDWLDTSALAQALEALSAAPSAPFLYTQAYQVAPDGSDLGLDARALRPWRRNQDLVHFSTFHLRLVRSSAYRAVGGYSACYSHAGDHDLSLRMAELGDPLHLPVPLYHYRLHMGSASQQQRLHTHLESVQAARDALHRRGLADTHRLIHHPLEEIVTLELRRSGPLVIAGLHRSGTSLLARALIRLGVDLGDRFPAADADNPQGYQEDGTVLALQRHWFQNDLPAGSGGWPDWGWTPDRTVSCLGRAAWRSQARFTIQQRRQSRPWGWKDPRTTLLLPFWQNLLGSIKVVGIIRAPWDSSDSLCRLRAEAFRTDPSITLPLWLLYNQRLLDFAEAHPEHTLLLQAESFAAAPNRLSDLLLQRWDLGCPQVHLSDLVDPQRLSALPLDDPLVGLYRMAYPELVAVWSQLIDRADLSSGTANLASPSRWTPPLQPRLSIVIATRNPSHWLLEAVASVLRHQQPEQVELLIVDDGSDQPEALRILRRLEEHGYALLRQPPRGLAAARNAGIRAARADLLLPLDDDNRLLRPYLTTALRIFELHPSVELVYGDRHDFGASQRRFRPGPLDRDRLVCANPIDACAVFRRSLWQRCGGYDERLTAFEDWDLWLTAAQDDLQACYLPELCFDYRVRENSMLRRLLADEQSCERLLAELRRKHGLPIALSPTDP